MTQPAYFKFRLMPSPKYALTMGIISAFAIFWAFACLWLHPYGALVSLMLVPLSFFTGLAGILGGIGSLISRRWLFGILAILLSAFGTYWGAAAIWLVISNAIRTGVWQ